MASLGMVWPGRAKLGKARRGSIVRDLVRWLWESTSTTERVLMLALGLCLTVMAVALLVGLLSAVSSSPGGVSPKVGTPTRVEQVYDPSTASPRTSGNSLDEEHP